MIHELKRLGKSWSQTINWVKYDMSLFSQNSTALLKNELQVDIIKKSLFVTLSIKKAARKIRELLKLSINQFSPLIINQGT